VIKGNAPKSGLVRNAIFHITENPVYLIDTRHCANSCAPEAVWESDLPEKTRNPVVHLCLSKQNFLKKGTVIIKGGAPKKFGAYVRRCLAAPLFLL